MRQSADCDRPADLLGTVARCLRDAAIGPALQDYLDRAARPADRDARTADQRLWHDGRAMACPAAAQPQPDATPESAGNEGAVACLSRIYEHRVAVLRYEQPCKIRSVSI